MAKRVLVAALVVGALSGQAAATTLSTHLTVDNDFLLLISTNDSVPGTALGGGTDWHTTYSFNAALTPGVTNYIHVGAHNIGGTAAFIGDFTLSDAKFRFANSSQFLVTDTAHWRVSPSAFGSGYVTPISFGPNGAAPWGMRPFIDASARFIWNSASPCTDCNVFFSTAILAAIPEPENYALMMAGLALLGFIARRRKKLGWR
jgi:hypothetical protein